MAPLGAHLNSKTWGVTWVWDYTELCPGPIKSSQRFLERVYSGEGGSLNWNFHMEFICCWQWGMQKRTSIPSPSPDSLTTQNEWILLGMGACLESWLLQSLMQKDHLRSGTCNHRERHSKSYHKMRGSASYFLLSKIFLEKEHRDRSFQLLNNLHRYKDFKIAQMSIYFLNGKNLLNWSFSLNKWIVIIGIYVWGPFCKLLL